MKLNLYLSWLSLSSAPPLAPEIKGVNFGDSDLTVTWRSRETVDGFNFSITPNNLRCSMNSMTTAICPYDMTHRGQTYTYTVAAYNCGNQRGDNANSEHTQLQLTHVTSAAQSRLNYLVYLSQKLYDQLRHCSPSCFYILAWYRCWLIIRCFVIVVLQSQTLEGKTRVRLRKTIV